ncbi:MAG: VacJ family lipoprotein [Pseudomonadota bacterium]
MPMLQGCLNTTSPGEAHRGNSGCCTEPVFSARRVLIDDVVDPLEVYDPWRSANRALYGFNAAVDRYALNPAVAGYRRALPGPVRQGITNFFDNLDMIRTTFNLALQGRGGDTGRAALRLLTNSTLGIGGVLDVADWMHQPTYNEDFGQTLGRYGVSPGPYVMLPLFGPSNLRDTLGQVVDAALLGFLDPLELNGNAARGIVYYPLLVLDTRATTAFQYFQSGSPFEYELVRKLWATKRELDIAK